MFLSYYSPYEAKLLANAYVTGWALGARYALYQYFIGQHIQRRGFTTVFVRCINAQLALHVVKAAGE
jgi:hypothetical protein